MTALFILLGYAFWVMVYSLSIMGAFLVFLAVSAFWSEDA